MYQFTYEVGGAMSRGGICNNSNSIIAACQDPGSAYVDNKYFQMNYSRCYDVSTSKDQSMIRTSVFLSNNRSLILNAWKL